MRSPGLLLCGLLACGAVPAVLAEEPLVADPADALPAAAAEPTGIRSAGDLSVEERTRMMQAANAYSTCVYQEAMGNLDSHPDIRRIADLALGQCQPQLDHLRSTIAGWGIDPYFAEGFTRNVRDRATHQLLAELAVKKGR